MERNGLARLRVDYARNAPRGQTVLLTQSYATGQYVLQAAIMRELYWERLEELTGKSRKRGAGSKRDDEGKDHDSRRRNR